MAFWDQLARAEKVAFVAAGFAILGGLGPWFSLFGATFYGIEGDGWFIAIPAGISMFFLARRQMSKRHLWAAILLGIATLISIVKLLDAPFRLMSFGIPVALAGSLIGASAAWTARKLQPGPQIAPSDPGRAEASPASDPFPPAPPPPTGKAASRRTMWAVAGAIVVIGFIVVLGTPDEGMTAAKAENNPTEKELIDLLLVAPDMPIGWEAREPSSVTIPEVGFNGGAKRTMIRAASSDDFEAVITTVWRFTDSTGAAAYYGRESGWRQERSSTQSAAVGAEAIYWEDSVDRQQILFRKGNVVWSVDHQRGRFTWEWSTDTVDLAKMLSAKY